MKVLHVIANLENGGAEAVLYRLATFASDVEHHVVSLGGPGWYTPMLEAKGVSVEHLNVTHGWRRALLPQKFAAALARYKPNVVQTWMYRSNLTAGTVAKLMGYPVIWGIHCSSFALLPARARRWAYASAALVRAVPRYIINCSAVSREIHAKLGYDAVAGAVIHNGYDTGVFFPEDDERSATRERLGLAPDTFLLGTVARWHMQKDHPNMFAALQLLESGNRDWRCLLVGPDMTLENPALVASLEKFGIADKAICLGPRHDIPDLMRALDLHVLSSGGGEAFPNVVAEAMACGTPCLVTDVGDSGYMVGDTGWIVPPKNPAELSKALGSAIDERNGAPGDWERRRESARARIVQNFTLAPMVAAYEQVWRQMAPSPAPEPSLATR